MLRNEYLELDVLDSAYDLKIFGTPYCARYGNIQQTRHIEISEIIFQGYFHYHILY